MASDHEVRQGESLLSIATREGFFSDTLWNDAANAALKDLRKDPDILFPGDIVHIPDLREKTTTKPPEQRHRFRRKGVPAKLRLRLMQEEVDEDEAQGETAEPGVYVTESITPRKVPTPRANAAYRLIVDGALIQEAATDGDGKLEATIPPGAKFAVVELVDPKISYRLRLHQMDPVSETNGMVKRLSNLGFACPESATVESATLAKAIGDFQRVYELEVTNQPDQATRDRLETEHGG